MVYRTEEIAEADKSGLTVEYDEVRQYYAHVFWLGIIDRLFYRIEIERDTDGYVFVTLYRRTIFWRWRQVVHTSFQPSS